MTDTPQPRRTPTPMQVLAEALRAELISLREGAEIDSPRAMARVLGRQTDQGHMNFWRFERGRTEWPANVDDLVQDYADAAKVHADSVWLAVARRWVEALAGGEGPNIADRISE